MFRPFLVYQEKKSGFSCVAQKYLIRRATPDSLIEYNIVRQVSLRKNGTYCKKWVRETLTNLLDNCSCFYCHLLTFFSKSTFFSSKNLSGTLSDCQRVFGWLGNQLKKQRKYPKCGFIGVKKLYFTLLELKSTVCKGYQPIKLAGKELNQHTTMQIGSNRKR